MQSQYNYENPDILESPNVVTETDNELFGTQEDDLEVQGMLLRSKGYAWRHAPGYAIGRNPLYSLY